MRVLISGGGTGGHLFPAIAVAQALARSDPEGAILYVGRRGGIEEQIVPRYGIPSALIHAVKLDMESRWRNWKVPFLLPGVLWEAGRILARFRPQVVLGTGGYVSAPLVALAASRRIPVVLQEQNYLPGRTTRMLSRLARLVATAYEESAEYLPGRRTVTTGTPVRADFQSPRADFPERPRRVLVLGGSQGARRLNRAVAEAVAGLLGRAPIELIHQTGPAELSDLQRVAAQLPSGVRERYHPFGFADDLPQRLRRADLVVSRAGASTISETSALGIPMVLVPGAFAGGHQRYNATPFARAGAALVIDDAEFDGARLTRELLGIVEDPSRYKRMVEAMHRLGRPHAADAIVELLRQVAA